MIRNTIAAFAVCVGLCAPLPCFADTSAPYAFAAAFIRTLGDLETVRDNAKADLKSGGNPMEDCVRNMESFQLELNGDIAMLKQIHLTGQLSDAPSTFANLFSDERDQYRAMEDYCTKLITPDPKVDYTALAGEAPKITARLNYIDESIFKSSPLVFGALIRPTPDAQNHMSHLSITRAQRDELASSIKSKFGKKLDAKDQNFTVSAASTLLFYLEKKGYKGSDEP
jgi:hypothetical protein